MPNEAFKAITSFPHYGNNKAIVHLLLLYAESRFLAVSVQKSRKKETVGLLEVKNLMKYKNSLTRLKSGCLTMKKIDASYLSAFTGDNVVWRTF